MSTNRVMIDAAAGIFELEGEADFVATQLDKLLPIISAGGFDKAQTDEGSTERDDLSSATETPGKESKKKGRRGKSNRPPKGHSCADRILTLREDGFFKEQKTPSEIVEGLAAKGWTHTNNQVSAALSKMFERGEIQRTKVDKGFAYFWDRE